MYSYRRRIVPAIYTYAYVYECKFRKSFVMFNVNEDIELKIVHIMISHISLGLGLLIFASSLYNVQTTFYLTFCHYITYYSNSAIFMLSFLGLA